MPEITKQAKARRLPATLRKRIADTLQKEPQKPWDVALAEVLGVRKISEAAERDQIQERNQPAAPDEPKKQPPIILRRPTE